MILIKSSDRRPSDVRSKLTEVNFSCVIVRFIIRLVNLNNENTGISSMGLNLTTCCFLRDNCRVIIGSQGDFFDMWKFKNIYDFFGVEKKISFFFFLQLPSDFIKLTSKSQEEQ